MTDWLDPRWPPMDCDPFRGGGVLRGVWFCGNRGAAARMAPGDRVLLYEVRENPGGRVTRVRDWQPRIGAKAIAGWGVVTGRQEGCEPEWINGRAWDTCVPLEVRVHVPGWRTELGVPLARVRQIIRQVSGREIALRRLQRLRPGEFAALLAELQRRIDASGG